MKNGLPPDPERLNGNRARWAETALLAFQRETGTDPEDAVADFLCDLMHLADRRAWHFEIELERAQAHYEIETTPDAEDLLAAAVRVVECWSSGDLAGAIRQLDVAISAAKAEAP